MVRILYPQVLDKSEMQETIQRLIKRSSYELATSVTRVRLRETLRGCHDHKIGKYQHTRNATSWSILRAWMSLAPHSAVCYGKCHLLRNFFCVVRGFQFQYVFCTAHCDPDSQFPHFVKVGKSENKSEKIVEVK